MAEAVFRHKVAEAGLADRIEVDSAGTGDWHTGKPPHEGTRRILMRYGINDAGIRARQVREDDFGRFQYLIAMDDSNVSNLMRLSSERAEVRKLMDLVPGREGEDVPDPYYTGNFQEVYEMVNEACDRLLAHIREREGWL
jgi:protein-tyrosine phosphatase